jgi:TRAP-type C4-dicarboxylate transport system permease small subunit
MRRMRRWTCRARSRGLGCAGLFWLLGATVFYQFFTRYVLNDSAAWTEEIARYLLIAVVFTGATIGVVKNNHIQVDFFYKLHAQAACPRALSTLVDVAARGLLCGRRGADGDDDAQAGQQLTHDHGGPAHELVYGVCLLGFAAMAFRSVQVALFPLASAATACWNDPSPPWTTADRKPHAQDHFPVPHGRRHSRWPWPWRALPCSTSWWTGNLPPFVVIHRMVSGIDSFPLLAVPFFILAGNLMNNAGITNRIYNYALALVGWLKGGLGHVNVVGSVVFAGMSGTAIADAAGLGTIEIKAMKEHGYSTEFAVGVTAASATLGPIIPPSLPFVIYGMMANVSVGALFLAGILPGRADGAPDDADGGLFRPQERLGRRHPVRVAARAQGAGRDGRGGHACGRWGCGR